MVCCLWRQVRTPPERAPASPERLAMGAAFGGATVRRTVSRSASPLPEGAACAAVPPGGASFEWGVKGSGWPRTAAAPTVVCTLSRQVIATPERAPALTQRLAGGWPAAARRAAGAAVPPGGAPFEWSAKGNGWPRTAAAPTVVCALWRQVIATPERALPSPKRLASGAASRCPRGPLARLFPSGGAPFGRGAKGHGQPLPGGPLGAAYTGRVRRNR